MERGCRVEEFRSGFVGIIGEPNAGKSTLVNAIVGEKIAIVSDKPQTTRRRILGIKTLPSAQLILIDTPGIHKSEKIFNMLMVKNAFKVLKESDVLIHIVDIERVDTKENQWIETEISRNKKNFKTILALNKIDLVKKSLILPVIDRSAKKGIYEEIVPISALLNNGVDLLINLIVKYLPEGTKLYPDDIKTDQTERVIVQELIREKLFNLLREEVPYSTEILVEDFDESREDFIKISATIFVEKESHKGIVIGKNGAMLKTVGTMAREDIERILGCKVYLELWVKVRKNWSKDKSFLHKLGYL